jgi:hypothetical protein
MNKEQNIGSYIFKNTTETSLHFCNAYNFMPYFVLKIGFC